MKLAAYANRLSARPGEVIQFHVSSATGAPVATRVVHVACADPNPAIGGVRTQDVPVKIDEVRAPSAQRVPSGSYGRIVGLGGKLGAGGVTLVARVMRNALLDRREAFLTLAPSSAPDGSASVTLGVDARGRLAAWKGSDEVVTAEAMEEGQWYLIWATINSDGSVMIARQGVTEGTAEGPVSSATGTLSKTDLTALDTLFIGATRDGDDTSRLNGRVEAPAIFAGVLAKVTEVQHALGGADQAGVVGRWDLSKEIPTDRIVDVGPNGLDGTLHNSPARGMTGSNWTGREMCWRHALGEYGATHFHSDDVDDCRWPVTHTLSVPTDMKSGQYALLLESGGQVENVPFFVVPPKGKTTARLAVLVSTFTYTVYGNHARPEFQLDTEWKDAWRTQAKAWNAYPHNPGDNEQFGLSTYNYHPDGSGISLASWHRPMLNVRVGYFTYPNPEIRGSGQRHYPGDTHLTAWLDAKSIPYDIITDWELHHEGLDILKGYQVVTTGTHPEYHTREMLDALEAYKKEGGRFLYLGGNGFYWKIALNPARDGQIEIRRGEGGIRAWAAEPGEYYNQLDGEYGGLWRRNGRPPQHLTGVGFTAQGNFVGSHYRIDPDARASRAG